MELNEEEILFQSLVRIVTRIVVKDMSKQK